MITPSQSRSESQVLPKGAPRIAVLLPCRNEGVSISETVRGFRAALPFADIYVYDNASTDDTAQAARSAGATVCREPNPGKGNVVRRMFADVEADIYVMADGDATYDAASAPRLIEALNAERLDMVVAARAETEDAAYRRGHRFGNWMLTSLVAFIFGQKLSDMLSGYRVFSRRFVKSFPSLAKGFEIETELTVHALEIRAPMSEIDTPYFPRVDGSESKLRTFRDGFRILRLILRLMRDERPLSFFGLIGVVLGAVAAGLAIPVALDYLATGLVPRLPTWILSAALGIIGALSLSVGLVLDTVTRGRREMRRLAYLAIPR